MVVSIEFKSDWERNRRATGLADELAAIIQNSMPVEALAGGVLARLIQLKDPHPDVSRIYIGDTEQALGGRWVASIAGYGQCAMAADIVATVGGKEAQVRIYKQAAPAVWLLIDCDLEGQGIFLDVPELPVPFAITTDFDRVFCCGFGMLHWVEIPCSRP